MKKSITFLLLLITSSLIQAQQPRFDKGYFREYKAGYFENSILRGIENDESEKKPEVKKKTFKIDITGMDVPKSVDEFQSWWKNEPISQGNTGTCWSFSTTSYFETEVYRLTKQQVKISEMYTAYWEYVEKAKRFVEERGNSNFDEGSEGDAVIRIYEKYGAVPFESYTGLLPGQKFYVHTKMVAEMKAYLNGIKANNAWNDTEAITTIKSIMNHYMGIPPVSVLSGGKEMTPKDYLKNVLKLKMDDYVDITSLLEKPYWEKVEYEVPDNWWHSHDYYNLPLDIYMSIIKNSIRKGYTIMIGGDVSEAGFDAQNNIAVVPAFDIPSENIDENARQFRFSNKSTTDDHGMHLVGYMQKNGKDWYLVKDSGAGSRNCGKESKNFGFYFFHEDYVKLKIMDILVHKDMIGDYLGKFKI